MNCVCVTKVLIKMIEFNILPFYLWYIIDCMFHFKFYCIYLLQTPLIIENIFIMFVDTF